MADAVRDGLEAYLRETHRAPSLRVTECDPIPEGHSGWTYFVTTVDGDQERRYVLRLPPPGARIAGPADIPRQGRIMAALNDQGLPTPRIAVNCTDPVLDGRPFVLMERIDGVRIEAIVGQVPARAIATAACDLLHRLQQVPVAESGIGDEKPVPLTEEMMRWAWLMQRAPDELTGKAPELGTLLARKQPPEPAPTLVHADFHYGNMLFRVEDGKPEIVALLDWEIAETGAPLLDLGCLCVVAQRGRADPDAPNPGGGLQIDADEVIGIFGADPEEARWYLALSAYKYASIFGYNLMLHRRGKRPDPMYEKLTGVIMALIDGGIDLLT